MQPAGIYIIYSHLNVCVCVSTVRTVSTHTLLTTVDALCHLSANVRVKIDAPGVLSLLEVCLCHYVARQGNNTSRTDQCGSIRKNLSANVRVKIDALLVCN